MIRKLFIAATLAVVVIATSVGATVATAHFAPELLPPGQAGHQGPRGPEGPTGPAGLDGEDGKDGGDGVDGLDSTDAAGGASGEDLAPNGMHKPEYRAYCSDLYERWHEGGDKEAIQEYGDALCDQ